MLTTLALLITVGVLSVSTFPLADAATDTDYSRLRRYLLQDYDKNSRPMQKDSNVSWVYLKFNLRSIDLDEEKSVFTMQAVTDYIWIDDHLKWKAEDYGNISEVYFAGDELWVPDIMAYNYVDKSEIDHYAEAPIIVRDISFINWSPPTKMQVGCTTNLRKWPFDEQKCVVKVGSWSHNGEDINITSWDDFDLVGFTANREWDLTKTDIEERSEYYSSVDVPSTEMVYTFHLRRRYAAHAACIVMPGVVITVATLVAFWLPPGSNERTSILLVTLVIDMFFLNNVYNMIPNNGDSTPLVVLFYRNSLVILIVSLFITVGLRYLAKTKREESVRLPDILVSYFIEGIPGKLLCLKPRPQRDENSSSQSDEGGLEKRKLFEEDWAWLAHFLDRVTFFIFVWVYLGFYLALL